MGPLPLVHFPFLMTMAHIMTADKMNLNRVEEYFRMAESTMPDAERPFVNLANWSLPKKLGGVGDSDTRSKGLDHNSGNSRHGNTSLTREF